MGALFIGIRFLPRLAVQHAERGREGFLGPDPDDATLARKPGLLPLRERSCRSDDLPFRLLPVRASRDPLGDLAIPDSPKPVRVRPDSALVQPPDFRVPTRVQHAFDSRGDPSIEVLARRFDADLENPPALGPS